MMMLGNQASIDAVRAQMAADHKEAALARLARQSRGPRASRLLAALRSIMPRRTPAAPPAQTDKVHA